MAHMYRRSVAEMSGDADLFNEISQQGEPYDASVLTNASAATMEPTNQPPIVPYWGLATRIVFASLIGLIMILAIIGNILVILVVAKNRGMRTRTNIFLCNLAAADLACAIIDMPVYMVTMAAGRWVFNNAICQLNGFLTPLFLVASIHTLMYMSMHKYLSIKKPFSQGLRRRWIYTMLGLAWCWAVLAGYTTVHGLNRVTYKPYTAQCGASYPEDFHTYVHFGLIITTCFLIPLAVMIFCYANVFYEMVAHSKRMERNTTLEKDAILLQQRRITCTLFLVLLIFTLTWLPYNAYAIYVALLEDKTQIPLRINPFIYLFGYSNSAINPIIYALRSPAFRQGYKQIIGLWSFRRSYFSKDSYPGSLSRRFSRFRSYLHLNLQPRLKDADSYTGSLPPSRKNSLNILASNILFPRSRRTLSTSSLPQQVVRSKSMSLPGSQRGYGPLKNPNTMRKWFNSLQRRSKPKIGVDIEDGNICRLNNGVTDCAIPEVIVTAADEFFTLLHENSPNACDHSDVEDDVFWEDDVTLDHAPIFHVAQTSVTPEYDMATHRVFEELSSPVDCAMYDYATETPMTDIRIHVDDYSKLADAQKLESYNDQLNIVKNRPGPTDTLNVDTSTAKGFIQNLMRKASIRRVGKSKKTSKVSRSEIKSDGTVFTEKRSATMNHLDRFFSEQYGNQTIPKSSSAPLLDSTQFEKSQETPKHSGRKFGLGYFARSWSKDKAESKHRHKRNSSDDNPSDKLRRKKSEKVKKIRRYPSIETLDAVPRDVIPRSYTEVPDAHHTNHHNKVKHRKHGHVGQTDTGRKVNSSIEPSWFLRENKHGRRPRSTVKSREAPKEKHIVKVPNVRLHRSASDPCLTFKMIEEKVLTRAYTKKERKKRVKSKFNRVRVPTDATYSCQVDFSIGDGDDVNGESRDAHVTSADHDLDDIPDRDSDSRTSYYDNVTHAPLDAPFSRNALTSSASMNILDLSRNASTVSTDIIVASSAETNNMYVPEARHPHWQDMDHVHHFPVDEEIVADMIQCSDTPVSMYQSASQKVTIHEPPVIIIPNITVVDYDNVPNTYPVAVPDQNNDPVIASSNSQSLDRVLPARHSPQFFVSEAHYQSADVEQESCHAAAGGNAARIQSDSSVQYSNY